MAESCPEAGERRVAALWQAGVSPPEHKKGNFVRFGASEPPFQAFRAQNRGFCAFLAFVTPVFGLFEHKIAIFVLEQRDKWHREA